MGIHVDQAARVVGPVAAADATGRTGVTRYAITASNQTVALPTSSLAPSKKHSLAARFIRIVAIGQNCQFAFGAGSAPTLVSDQTAALGTGNAGAGMTLIDGVPEQFLVPSEATHLAFIGTSATGFLEFYVSDQPYV